jgi:hypothetical protein
VAFIITITVAILVYIFIPYSVSCPNAHRTRQALSRFSLMRDF